MTRRGSLIYYLTAWICGCFFMSLAIWIRDLWGATVTSSRSREAFGVLFFYFYGLVFAATNHDAAEMQDAAALGYRRSNPRAVAGRRPRRMGTARGRGTAARAAPAFLLAAGTGDGAAGGVVAGDVCGGRGELFCLPH